MEIEMNILDFYKECHHITSVELQHFLMSYDDSDLNFVVCSNESKSLSYQLNLRSFLINCIAFNEVLKGRNVLILNDGLKYLHPLSFVNSTMLDNSDFKLNREKDDYDIINNCNGSHIRIVDASSKRTIYDECDYQVVIVYGRDVYIPTEFKKRVKIILCDESTESKVKDENICLDMRKYRTWRI